MKFTQIPLRHDAVVETLGSYGHVYVDNLSEADFVVFDGAPEDVPHPMPSNIRFVQTQYAGVEALHSSGVMKRSGVPWANAKGLYADTVAESTVALILGLYHQLKLAITRSTFDAQDEVSRRKDFLFRDKTVAVVGAGGIGEKLIELLNPFGVTTVAVNRSGQSVPGADRTVTLDEGSEVWREADVIVLLLPLTESTRNIVNAERLRMMKNSALVVNVGRGALIDTDALVEALEKEEIAGAALDVTDPEPLSDGHPLWDMDNVIITPHVANPPWNIREQIGHLAARNAERIARGEKLETSINLEAGY